jgi:hypothetical protein
MNLSDVANTRLASQQIAGTELRTPKDVVGWMGAVQAQDFAMSRWAIGLRLPDSSEQIVETAIAKGEIIRTHLLRPTWHFVSAEDIYWMLELSSARVKASFTSRHQELGLNETIIAKSNAIIARALQGGKNLAREELISELNHALIATDGNRASHLFARAELDGILCSGATLNGKQTYALLAERVPKTNSLTREEALSRLANKYFTSHCPATIQDFAWWSGLPAGAAKLALEMVKADFISETIDSQTYWFRQPFSRPQSGKDSVYLLPAFDEFIISYTDRRATLPSENYTQAVIANGMFKPVIILNGQVAGIWKRTIKKEKVVVDVDFFNQPDKTILDLVEEAAIRYGHFLEKKAEIKHTL